MTLAPLNGLTFCQHGFSTDLVNFSENIAKELNNFVCFAAGELQPRSVLIWFHQDATNRLRTVQPAFSAALHRHQNRRAARGRKSSF
jgi:hypothetical protein